MHRILRKIGYFLGAVFLRAQPKKGKSMTGNLGTIQKELINENKLPCRL